MGANTMIGKMLLCPLSLPVEIEFVQVLVPVLLRGIVNRPPVVLCHQDADALRQC